MLKYLHMVGIPQLEPSHEIIPGSRRDKEIKTEEFETPHIIASASTIASANHPERNEDAYLVDRDEELIAVFDGVGGALAGDEASRLARDLLPIFYKRSKNKTRSLSRAECDHVWHEIILSNSYVTEEDAATQEKHQKIFEEDIARAKELMDSLPEEIKLEAMAIYLALQELSKEILNRAIGDKKLKGMSTTASGIKFIETKEGRQFAISWGVGDSDVWIERAQTGETFRAVKTDNALEILLGRKTLKREETADLSNPAIRRYRFAGMSQFLGYAPGIIPHITIWEIFPGDRFILNTDGVSDNDLEERYKTKVRNRKNEPWSRTTQEIITTTNEFINRGVGKGPDDATIIVGEFKLPKWLITWREIVETEILEAIEREDLSDGEVAEIKNMINELRGDIAKKTREEAEQAAAEIGGVGRTPSPKEVTALLRHNLKTEIKRILEEIRERKAESGN